MGPIHRKPFFIHHREEQQNFQEHGRTSQQTLCQIRDEIVLWVGLLAPHAPNQAKAMLGELIPPTPAQDPNDSSADEGDTHVADTPK